MEAHRRCFTYYRRSRRSFSRAGLVGAGAASTPVTTAGGIAAAAGGSVLFVDGADNMGKGAMTVITGQDGGRTVLNDSLVSLSCLSGSSNCQIIGDAVYMVGTLAGEAGAAYQLGKGTSLI